MSYNDIIVQTGDDFIAEITLNRPDQMNTFTSSLAMELDNALKELDAEPGVRVIIIKGAGKAFCAGIDLSEFPGKTTMEYQSWVERMENPFITISRMKKPVIAQVHGVAVANGAGLVAACDLAVADDKARLGLTAINVGLNCVGPIVPVSRSIGRKRALELLFHGNMISSRTALDMGLINRIFPKADLEKETRSWAAELAQKSPVALQLAKKAFYSAEDLDYYKAFEYMNEAFARLCSTHDANEGIKAFKEKRKPSWEEK
jgi:enoyl-CoA hydratase/carnithine racemase